MRAAALFRVGLVLLLGTSPVVGQELTADEAKCQQALASALEKFGAVKAKCLVKCDRSAAKGKSPETDCLPPLAGKTAACVAAADAKASDAAAKKCSADCPECFAGADCPGFTATQLAGAAIAIDAGAAIVRCDDSASADGLTAPERRCREAAASQGGKLVSSYGKCLAHCHAREQKGKLPPGSCTPGAVADEKTNACLDKAFTTCVLQADAKCPDPPECLGDVFFVCLGVTGVVESFDPVVFCGSPGGAFLDQSS